MSTCDWILWTLFFFLVFVCLRECACVCGCVCMCVCIKKFRYKVACQSLCSHCCLPLLYTSFLNNTRTNLAHSIFLHPALLSFPPPPSPLTHISFPQHLTLALYNLLQQATHSLFKSHLRFPDWFLIPWLH